MAQPGQAEVVERNGRKYYLHVVEQGNTLWGLHRLYSVEVEDIVNANPGVEDGLSVGSRLLIPVPGGQHSVSNGAQGKLHVVEAGETLYGISRKYGTTVEELTRLNPGAESGLSVGMVLKLPTSGQTVQTPEPLDLGVEPPEYEVNVSDSTVTHIVKRGETLYSIAKRFLVTVDELQEANPQIGRGIRKGDRLIIPLKQVDLTPVEKDVPEEMTGPAGVAPGTPQRKASYKVALLMPFMLHKNQSLISGSYVQRPEMPAITRNAIAFYQGFKMAMDSLTKAGFNVELVALDTRNDSLTTARALAKLKLDMPDLIVGPVLPDRVAQVNRFSMENGVTLVLPFKTDPRVIKGNPQVVQSVTPSDMQLAAMARWLAQKHGRHNVLMLDSKRAKDRPLMDLVASEYNQALKHQSMVYRSSLKEVEMGSSSGRDLLPHLKRDTLNVIVAPTLSETVANDLFRRLSKVKDHSGGWKDVRIMVVGGTSWSAFNSLKTEQMVENMVTYPAVNHMDFESAQTKHFIKEFRKDYSTDPNEVAAQGFDVGMFFGGGLYLLGTNNQPIISSISVPQVQNDFSISQDLEDLNWKNTHVKMLQYQGYKLREVK